ncbi:MAG: anaerobic ribonucleoside-triphosphate reductase [Elusimicrobia bacterium]|nr:anaerobic ribonucleoside-triphosphate reductase [Elusimicrobiota bacterium]
MERSEIAAKIAELKKLKGLAKGTPCEVFSRVVGYLRPVQNWNDGKKEEYKLRKHFTCGCKQTPRRIKNGGAGGG